MEIQAVMAILDLVSDTPTTLALSYDKHDGQAPAPRIVEPYSFSSGHGDVLLRCYQIAPEEGWRMFMLAKIVELRPTGEIFRPRRHMAFADGPFLSPATEDPDEEQAAEDLDAVTGKAYHGKAPAKEYARRVLHALADMKITLDESAELAGFRTEHGITPQVMRAVHWKIFAKHLNTILADGIVDDEELRYLRDLNACLHLCGAGMLE